MVWTQVRLSADQVARLKARALEEGVSLAELVRRAVERYLAEEEGGGYEERARRALGAVGRFASGAGDVGEAHDRYLEEAFRGLR
jgi:predicted DNA-binding protein